MLAFSVREALRQAAAAFGPPGTSVDLASPATPEAVWWAIEEARGGAEPPHMTAMVEGGTGVVPDQPGNGAHPIEPRSERAQRVSSGA
jgi:xanthine dehydrogenase large subunit